MNFEPAGKDTYYSAAPIGSYEVRGTVSLPTYAGTWTIGGNFCVQVKKRPRWLTRKLMRWLLEWKWEDAK